MAANFDVIILAPREVEGGDTIPIRAVVVPLDDKKSIRDEMAELARDILTKSYDLGTLNSAVLIALEGLFNGKGVFEYSIGEFFLLYGKFEERHQSDGKKTRQTMLNLLGKDRRYSKFCKDPDGLKRWHPLPYAVRNILAHKGRSPNQLDREGQELRASIELLRKWLSD